jgi:PAS domain S-box-containing protein
MLGCNDQQAKDLGYSSWKEIAGKSLYELHPKEQADIIIQNNNMIISSGREQIIEEPFPSPDGRELVYMSHKIPLKHEGEIIGILGISTDITAEKEAEQLKIEKLAVEESLKAAQLMAASIWAGWRWIWLRWVRLQ